MFSRTNPEIALRVWKTPSPVFAEASNDGTPTLLRVFLQLLDRSAFFRSRLLY
jgi:hypothetical protein